MKQTIYNSYTEGVECNSLLWMLCRVTGCVVADIDVTIHLRRLESLTISLKTSNLANVQICQNIRISGSLLRSELGGVVCCQNSIMGKV
jgi:hypothetical protein